MYPSSEWRLESYVIIFWPFFLSLFSKFWSSSFSSSSSFVACWVIVTSQESQVWHIATRAARPKAAKGQCQQNVFRTDPPDEDRTSKVSHLAFLVFDAFFFFSAADIIVGFGFRNLVPKGNHCVES